MLLTKSYQELLKKSIANTGYGTIYLILSAKYNSQNSATSKTIIGYKLELQLTSGSFYSSGCSYAVKLSGTTVNSASNVYMNYSAGKYTLLEGTSEVTSNDDGTSKSWALSFSYDIYGVSGNDGEMFTVPTIQRYATCNQSLNSIEETVARINWSSDSVCDYLWYSIDNGSNWVAVGSINGTNGTYSISGLSSNTSYNIKTRVRRKDSQLTTDSSNLNVTTYQYPYITAISNSSITIGNQQTVSLYNPLKRNVTVYMKKDSISGTTLYSGNTTGTSITFTPDANKLYSTIPDKTLANAVYYCTYSNQTIATKSGTYSIDVNECKPSFNNFDYSTNLSELTNNSNTIIDGETTTTFIVSSSNKAVAKNSASISKYRIECGSQSTDIAYSSNSDVSGSITNCKSQTLKVTAIDSRGLETTVIKTVVNYINYFKPIITGSTIRKDGVEAETHLNLNINFFNGNFGNGTNKITSLKYRVRTGASWSEYFSIDTNNITYSNNNAILENYLIHANGSSGGFNVGTSYGIQIMASDGLDTYTLEIAYSDILEVTDGKVAFSILQDSTGTYHVGIDGMPSLDYVLTVGGIGVLKYIDD